MKILKCFSNSFFLILFADSIIIVTERKKGVWKLIYTKKFVTLQKFIGKYISYSFNTYIIEIYLFIPSSFITIWKNIYILSFWFLLYIYSNLMYSQVRRYAQSFIQPGIKLVDMCERLEECNRRLVKENGLQVS